MEPMVRPGSGNRWSDRGVGTAGTEIGIGNVRIKFSSFRWNRNETGPTQTVAITSGDKCKIIFKKNIF